MRADALTQRQTDVDAAAADADADGTGRGAFFVSVPCGMPDARKLRGYIHPHRQHRSTVTTSIIYIICLCACEMGDVTA